MSGGVDSSVAAYLLKNRGYEVTGVFMRCFNVDGCSEQDAEDARRAAGHLEIPFYVWDFEAEYKKKVVGYMIEGYRSGITPNPDVMCNKEIKFGLFLARALRLGADYVATGHYVRLRRNSEFRISNFENSGIDSKLKIQNSKSPFFSLLQARDKNKDQSYFLWTLTQKQLRHCLFPIGSYLKGEVREIARKAKLPTAEKKDSQGICFLGKVTLTDFLKEYIPPRKGAVVRTDGIRAGEHDGAWFYTIGQRRMGVANLRRKSEDQKRYGDPSPFYIAAKDVVSNTIIVAEGTTDPALYRSEVSVTQVNMIVPHKPERREIPVMVRIRYRQPLIAAHFYPKGNEGRIVFENPVKFVAPGQSAVMYRKNGEMIGGGVIDR